MCSERQLTDEETKEVYNEITAKNLEPFDVFHDRKFTEFYYELDGKQYRLIFDAAGDWFYDLAYEGNYKED